MVKDYIGWFTKFGSVEGEFEIDKLQHLKLELRCLDREDYEVVPFGHFFPKTDDDIEKLFEKYGANAADYFVRRYSLKDRLKDMPEVTYEAVIYVEGDQVKRAYNPLVRDRKRKQTGTYKVADRYGIWLCKDHIPVQSINEWIIGFGTGSNSFTLLHGFVNCQKLKLTANRGSIANTEPKILDELKKSVQALLDQINTDLNKGGIYTLFQWQSEERTLSQEKEDFESRTKSVNSRKIAQWKERTFLEPRNESELFGLFSTICALSPDSFDFEPLDYNTNRGIDIVARNRTGNKISESQFWYVELKFVLQDKLNHGFKFLRWIVCWDFDRNVKADSEVTDIQESEVRRVEVSKDDEGRSLYFLNSKTSAVKVQVIRLREYLLQHLGIEFKDQN